MDQTVEAAGEVVVIESVDRQVRRAGAGIAADGAKLVSGVVGEAGTEGGDGISAGDALAGLIVETTERVVVEIVAEVGGAVDGGVDLGELVSAVV